MGLLVRTWNIFHGRTLPESGSTDPEAAVRLISDGLPDIVCLQEVPVWALAHLESWSGMAARPAVAMRALGGRFARRLTAIDPRLARSSLTGQANAVLVSPRLSIVADENLVLNPRSYRRQEERRAQLSFDARLEWRRNRRVGQFIRVVVDARSLLVVNMHLTTHHDSRPAERDLVRAVTHAEGIASPGEPILVCGDLNLTPASSDVLRGIERSGFTAPLRGIDQIVARGLGFSRAPEAWPEERRRTAGGLLSDHAPLEAEMMEA